MRWWGHVEIYITPMPYRVSCILSSIIDIINWYNIYISFFNICFHFLPVTLQYTHTHYLGVHTNTVPEYEHIVVPTVPHPERLQLHQQEGVLTWKLAKFVHFEYKIPGWAMLNFQDLHDYSFCVKVQAMMSGPLWIHQKHHNIHYQIST